jgi:ferritin-like protein
MTASEGFHEPIELLSQETMDRHRAIVSLMEELEAVDWYSQRVDATQDEELRAILKHNRDEEIEHATMVLEWLRRRDPVFGRELAARLFQEGSIVPDEHGEGGDAGGGAGAGRLGIGDLKTARQEGQED